MKKLIILSVIVLLGFGIAAPAFAYTLVNGQPVFGFVSGYKPLPGPEQAFVGGTVTTPDVQGSVFGNTRVYDLMKAINPSDVAAFLAIVKRAGIRY